MSKPMTKIIKRMKKFKDKQNKKVQTKKSLNEYYKEGNTNEDYVDSRVC